MAPLIVAGEELAIGSLTRRELRRRYRKVFQNVYAPTGVELTALDRARAAWLWSDRQAVLAGLSAAALLGSRWIPDDAPAELIRPEARAPAGIIVHTGAVGADEICLRNGMSCTTAARTVYDLGRRLPFTLGLIRTDALLHATALDLAEVSQIAQRNVGARHIRRLRQVLALADAGAESPQETRVRLMLVRAGLPRPVTQIPVRDARGSVIRRIDMGWPEFAVGVEYDGAQHWTDPRQHARDIDRLQLLADHGWRIIRVSAVHLRDDPRGVVDRVAAALRAAGCLL